MEYPILYTRKEACCGCSACWAACPAGAIRMERDKEGFEYPILDRVKCVKCFQCVKACSFQRDGREE